MDNPKFLVMGATGKTGSAVAAQLRHAGMPVRALVRRRDERSRALDAAGVETVVADPLDRQQMREALQGMNRAYFLPPFHPSMLKASDVFADAACAAGLESLVVLSQWLASPIHPAWLTRHLWQMEQTFGALPISLTIVGPPFFADNYLRLIGFAAHLGVLPSLTGDSRERSALERGHCGGRGCGFARSRGPCWATLHPDRTCAALHDGDGGYLVARTETQGPVCRNADVALSQGRANAGCAA